MVDGILLFSQVPVTMAAIRAIKEAGNQRPHGSCLAKFHSTLHDPAGLGGFDIASHEEERDRRGRARLEGGDESGHVSRDRSYFKINQSSQHYYIRRSYSIDSLQIRQTHNSTKW